MVDQEGQQLLGDGRLLERDTPTVKVISLYMKGRDLMNMDQDRDKSDCQVVLKMKWLSTQQDWSEVDRTEVIMDNLNPDWQSHFDVVFNFGQALHLRFEVVDANSDGSFSMVGYTETTLSALIRETEGKKMIEKNLMGENAPNAGFLSIGAEEKKSARQKIKMQVAVNGLPSCNSIMQCNFSTTYFLDEFNYRFAEMEFTDQDLCNGDLDAAIEFKFINRNQYKMDNVEICYFQTTLNELNKAADGRKMELEGSFGNKVKANMTVSNIEWEQLPTFTDYLRDGYEISLIGAIDFTYSNGL